MPLRTSCYSGLIQLILAILTVRALFMQARSRALADSISRPHRYLLQVVQAKLGQTRPSSAQHHASKGPITAADLLDNRRCLSLLSRAGLNTAGNPKPTITSSTLRSTPSRTPKPGKSSDDQGHS